MKNARPSRPAQTRKLAATPRTRGSSSVASRLALLLKRDLSTDAAAARFLTGLVESVWDFPSRRTVPFEELPEPARMIIVLEGMHRAIDSGGLLYVLDWSEGDQFHEAVSWLRKMGARRTVTYFTRAAALFPKHRVPKEKPERQRLADRLEANGRLDALDQAFRGEALTEIPKRLHAYLVENQRRVAKELASRTRVGASTSPDDVLSRGDMLEVIADIQNRALSSKDGVGYPAAAKVGDVVELAAGRWHCYVQVTHHHVFSRTVGPICRKLPGNFDRSLSRRALSKLVAGDTEYFVNFNVDRSLNDGEATIRTSIPVPAQGRALPTFLYWYGTTHDGRNVFRFWRGSGHHVGQVTGPLRGAHRFWPVVHYSQSASDLLSHFTPRKWLWALGER